MQNFDLSTSSKGHKVVYYILATLNRFAHFIDIIILAFLADYVYRVQLSGEMLGILIYVLPILQLILAVKYEYKVYKSKQTNNFILDNERVIIIQGGQGKGKSSYANYLNSNSRFKARYTNTPITYGGKFSNILTGEVLNLDERIEDNSSILIDEATLFYNNLKTMKKNDLKIELYSQEILTQLVRHFFDGTIFYISVEGGRLPKVIEENASCKLQMLGQTNKTISYITTPILKLIAKIFKIDLFSGLRCWQFQQFVKIGEEHYVFDLSTQKKDSDMANYANLVEVYAFDNPYRFSYNDRFMRGVYMQLPEHNPQQWKNFDFNRDLLRKIGYGEIVEFFDKKTLSKEEINKAIQEFEKKKE